MKIIKITTLLLCIYFGHSSLSQDINLSTRKGETSFGLGLGLPYGAIGIRLGTNLVDGLNLFGGIGYQLSGIGYNLGLRKEFNGSGLAQFYLLGMFGTNAAIKVEGLSEYNKVYSGATIGLGTKINSRKKEGNYWDVGILLPFRSSKYADDFETLENDPRISEITSPWPVLFTFGYNFIL